MHENAAAWDKKNKHTASAYVVENDILIPINRPCDWCGKPVEKGYLHDECMEPERSFWLDVIYG